MSAEAAVAPRDTSRPLPFLAAAHGVYRLALDGMLWSRRSLLMAIFLGLPIVFALLYRGLLIAHLPARMTAFDLYAVVIASYYVGRLLPLAALFYATSLIADEVEGRTLTYLLTRPLPRPAILAGKFAAYVTTTLAMTLPSVVITFFLLATAQGASSIGAEVPELFRDMGVVALTLVAYGGLFTLMGVLLRRPVIPGLLFLFVWELIANLPGYLPRFTLTAWLRSLLHHQPAEEGLGGLLATQILPAGEALAVLLGTSALFLALSFWIFAQREYVLEQ